MPKKSNSPFLKKPKEIQEAIVAQLHLVNDPPMSQKDIAEHFGILPSQVSNLLSDARKSGLVETRLRLNPDSKLNLELIDKYNIIDSVVTPVWYDEKHERPGIFREQLAYAAARYLEADHSPLLSGMKVGITCGSTMRDLVMSITPRHFNRLTISQLTIEADSDGHIDTSPLFLVGTLLAKSHAHADDDSKAYAIHPLRESLKMPDGEYPEAREKINELANDLDIALIGIGNAASGRNMGSFGRAIEESGQASKLRKLKVVGEICNRPFNKYGDDLFEEITELKNYFDGVSLEILKKIARTKKRVVAVAGGPNKYDAIHAALNARMINYLVTDRDTAIHLCERHD